MTGTFAVLAATCHLAPSPDTCEIAVGSTMTGFSGTLTLLETAWIPSLFVGANFTAVSPAGIADAVFWFPTGSAPRAWSLCRVTNRLVAPIEIAKPIMAACVRTRRLIFRFGAFKLSTGTSSLGLLSNTAFILFFNARFKDDLL